MVSTIKNLPFFCETDLVSWIRLIRTENIGPITFYELIKKFGSAKEAIFQLPNLDNKFKNILLFPEQHAIEELQNHRRLGAKLLPINHPHYPQALRILKDAPPVVSILGNASLLDQQSIAVVGARNSSIHGKNFAFSLAQELGSHKWCINSGLAYGIDTQAHKGSLSTGTTAVLACGVDQVYPPENQKLYEQIKDQGCILSEAPLGSAPHHGLFPRRNRLISALSRGVVVIEAAIKSGSLITANYALEQGKDVFAVPGSPLDPRCKGSNVLIQQGAHLLQSAQDILEFYGIFAHTNLLGTQDYDEDEDTVPTKDNQDVSLKAKIVKFLSFTPISLDELARQCQTSAACIQTAVIELELENKVVRSYGNEVALTKR